MNFLVDAQLPRRLTQRLRDAGHDAVHTLDLPDGNRTSDQRINDLAEQQGRVVVTKDADFVHTHLVNGRPSKLWLVSTGNISNNELERLLAANLDAITNALANHSFVELGRTTIIVHP